MFCFFLVGLLMTFELLMLSFVAHEFLVFQLATHDFWVAHVLFVTHDFFSCSCFFGLLMFFAFNRLLMTFELLMILCGFLMYFFKSSWLVGFWLFYLLLMTFYVYFFSKGCSSITFELFMALDPMTGYFRPLDGYFRPLDGYFRPLDFAHAWTNWFCTHEQLLMHEYPYMSSCSWVSFLLNMRHMSSCSWVWWFSE